MTTIRLLIVKHHMAKKLYLLFLLTPLTCVFCQKGELHNEELSKFDDEVISVLNKFIDKEKVAGMGLYYYSHKIGNNFFSIGMADMDNDIPIDTSCIYEIGSTTKMFVAISVLQLINEGKLSLKDKIVNWLHYPQLDSSITIQHLLNHTSGIGDYFANSDFIDSYYGNDNEATLDDLINAGIENSKTNSIGTWQYSNTNYVILAKIIESISGGTIGEYFQTLFDKAGMAKTYYMPEHTVKNISDLATGYQFGNSMKQDKNYYLYNAAGGIVSTLYDMSKFAKWLLESNYLDQMKRNSVECLIEHGMESTYGNGLLTVHNLYNTTTYGHGGTSFGFKSEFWISQETGEIIIYFTNDYMFKKNYSDFRKKLNKVFEKYR